MNPRTAELVSYLQRSSVNFEIIELPHPVYTAHGVAQALDVPSKSVIKAAVLKFGTVWPITAIAIAAADRSIKLRKIRRSSLKLDTNRTPIRLATDEEVSAFCRGGDRGAVSPVLTEDRSRLDATQVIWDEYLVAAGDREGFVYFKPWAHNCVIKIGRGYLYYLCRPDRVGDISVPNESHPGIMRKIIRALHWLRG